MKTKTTLRNCLLGLALLLLAPASPGASVTFRSLGYQFILLDSPQNNYIYIYLEDEAGRSLAALSSTATGSVGDCGVSSTASKVVSVVCGKTYKMTMVGVTCLSGFTMGFSSSAPLGYLYEFKDYNGNNVFDNKNAVTVRSGMSKVWQVSLQPKRVHFTVDPILADGQAKSRAQLCFLSGTSSNYFTGNPVWSIVGDNLGCTIDSTTGWIRGGKESGEVTVLAVDANSASRYVTGSLRVGCQSCSSGACGIGEGAIGTPRNALAVSLGVFPADNSFMGSIRLKLTNSASLTTPDGLTYDQTNTDNSVPTITKDASGLRQVMAPQCLADVVTNSSGYDLRLYWAADAGTTNSAGLYVPTGTAFKVWRVTAFANNQFSIIEDPAGANRTNTFTWNSTNNSWTLAKVSLSQERKTTQSQTPATGETARRTETTETSTPGATAVSAKYTKTISTLNLSGTQVPDVLVQEDLDGSAADGSAANPNLSTYYSYAPTATSDGHEKLQRMSRSDGYWEHYAYSGDLVTNVYTPWGDSAPPTDLSAAPTSVPHKETVYDYTLLPGDAGTDLVTPRKTEVYVKDSAAGSLQLVSRIFTILAIASNTYPRLNICSNIVCNNSTAAWSDSGNLVTITRTYLDGANKNALHSVDRPDGTRTYYAYSQLTTGLSTYTEVRDGAAHATDITAITDGQITKTTVNERGYVQTNQVMDFVSKKYLVSDIWSVPGATDPQARYTVLTHLDTTTEGFTYDCCSLVQSVDRNGVTTTYTPDALKRPWITTVYGIQTQNTFDASGNVTKTTRTGATAVDVLPSRKYDRAGRVISEQNALLGTNTVLEGTAAGGGRMVTTTYPNSGTRIEEYYRDGRLAKIRGTAAQPVQYEYAFDATAGQVYTKTTLLDTNAAPTSEWTKTYTDFVGREYKTVYADATGSPYTQKFFKDNGQLWKQRDADGVIEAFIYNTRGEVEYTMVGLESDPATPPTAPDTSGNHRIQRVQNTVSTYTDGGTAYDTTMIRTTEWVTPDSSDTIVSSEVHTSLDGLRRWSVLYPNDPSPQVARVVTQYGSGTKTTTTTFPDTSSEISVATNGRLSTVTRYSSVPGQVTQVLYGYDGDGHLSTVNDARNGTSTLTFNNADQVQTATTPAPAPGLSAQVTTIYYDKMSQATNVLQPDSTSTISEYYANGLLKKTYGSRTYPVQYTYDSQGRLQTMTTWQDFTGGAGTAVTTWNYDTNHGWLSSVKFNDNNGPSYQYYPSGRLQTRTWKRGVTATYGYNTSGSLASVSYSDGTSVTNGYNRRGRLQTVVENGTATTTFNYNNAGQLLSESYANGILAGVAITNGYDAYMRLTNVSSLGLQSLYGYDEASRLKSLSDGTNSATYSYVANSSLVDNIAFAQNANARMTTIKQYDYLTRLTNILARTNGTTIFSSRYQYNNANQRTNSVQADGSRWAYQFDSLGQVSSAKKYFSSGTPVAGQQFEYLFDTIGNRTRTKQGGDNYGSGLRSRTNSANLLNQYSQRTVPNAVDVLGNANSSATVSINGQRAYRSGDYFRKELAIDNSGAAVNQAVTNLAVLNNGTNADIIATNVGTLFLAKNPEVFGHDLDGNLTNDGRWVFTWNAENRLANVVALAAIPAAAKLKLDFAYDFSGRRLQKVVYTNNAGTYVGQYTNKFVYDGWNLIAILDANNNVAESFHWGSDLSGSLQGAGGVGGLLSLTVHSGSLAGAYFYNYDGNGNVVGLTRASDGTIAARYEYDAFGALLRASGPMAFLNPFLFSTKYYDWETSLYYFGHRYYNASTGRWLSRDPLGIEGGANPYAFVGNSPSSFVDPLGLRPLTAGEQAAIAKMRTVQAAIAAHPQDKKVADKIGSFISDFTARVAAIPDNQKDPANVAIASTAIVIWDKDSGKFNREVGKEKETPVTGLTTLKKEINITCNYYVADVLQRATGENLGRRSWSGNVWPPVANDYANPKKNVRLKNFSEVQSGGLGDVISFPVPGDSGHVGIYLGYDIYISSRTGDGPGTTGENPVQPFSGVQIKEVPTEERHVIIRHK